MGNVQLTLSDFEQRIAVNGLVDFRNDLIRNNRPTEDIDAILLKLIEAKQVGSGKRNREAR